MLGCAQGGREGRDRGPSARLTSGPIENTRSVAASLPMVFTRGSSRDPVAGPRLPEARRSLPSPAAGELERLLGLTGEATPPSRLLPVA